MLQASTKWWTAPAREGDVALATSEKLKPIAYMSSLYLNAVDIVAGQLLGAHQCHTIRNTACQPCLLNCAFWLNVQQSF